MLMVHFVEDTHTILCKQKLPTHKSHKPNDKTQQQHQPSEQNQQTLFVLKQASLPHRRKKHNDKPREEKPISSMSVNFFLILYPHDTMWGLPNHLSTSGSAPDGM